jgi:hypothetical protein
LQIATRAIKLSLRDSIQALTLCTTMTCTRIGFGIALFICLATIGHANTITLTSPSLENNLIQSSAGTLGNALGDIFVGRTNQPAGQSIRRGLMQFNVAGSIPSGATISGGTLTMTDVTSGSTGSQTLNLYAVSDSWGQGTSYVSGGAGTAATNNDATWLYRFYNSASPLTSLSWTNSGGDFSSTLSGAAMDSTNGQLVVWSSASNPQMTADIQSWLDNPAGNFGWLLEGNEGAPNTAKVLGAGPFYTGTGPALTISYTVPEPSTAWLVIAAILTIAAWQGVGERQVRVSPRPYSGEGQGVRASCNRRDYDGTYGT